MTGKRGSGTTHVLTARIRFLLDKEPDCGVLALTFTNKAAEETKARMVDVKGIDERCCGRISEYKRSAIGRLGAHARFGTEVLVVADESHRLLEAQDAIDFNDLLTLAFRVFNEVPDVADHDTRSYSHACVDESQELNAIQYALLEVFCRERDGTLMLVGDENQAIYGFNGSSADFMKKRFVSAFSPAQSELRESYRSTKRVLEAANALKPGLGGIGGGYGHWPRRPARLHVA